MDSFRDAFFLFQKDITGIYYNILNDFLYYFILLCYYIFALCYNYIVLLFYIDVLYCNLRWCIAGWESNAM